MLSVANNPITLSVVMLNVVAPITLSCVHTLQTSQVHVTFFFIRKKTLAYREVQHSVNKTLGANP
jgi:hypothetical protein